MLYGYCQLNFHIKTKGFSKDISDDVKKWFDTSNYEVDRPLSRGMNSKVIRSMKDELGGKIMREFVALKPETYFYLMDDGSKHKRAKGTKKCIIKREIKSKNYKNCFFKNGIKLKSEQRFKKETHCIYTEEINKIALSNNDDKRLQTFDKITTYPYEQMLLKYVKVRC